MIPGLPADPADRIFAVFDGRDDSPPLADLCTRLLAEQKATWPQLKDGCSAFEAVKSRVITMNGFSVQLQYNPRRINSTAAKVDPASIEKRPCFLCPGNLPAAQKGIRYGRDFLILCNPFPIFSPHYTIAHIRHVPQLIAGTLTLFLQLVADLGPSLSVLYNGALCGASAPDHMHFQAVPTGAMPIEAALDRSGGAHLTMESSRGSSIGGTRGPGWSIIRVEGDERDGLEAMLGKTMTAMQSVLPASGGEPMMNLCGSYGDHRWRVTIFPRRKHRPDIYYGREGERILVTPGAADMGGVIVTPRGEDFRRLDEGLIRTLFDDVSPDEDTLHRILAALTGC